MNPKLTDDEKDNIIALKSQLKEAELNVKLAKLELINKTMLDMSNSGDYFVYEQRLDDCHRAWFAYHSYLEKISDRLKNEINKS